MKANLLYIQLLLFCSLLNVIHARKIDPFQPRSSRMQPRIVGGSNAAKDEFPHFVQIGLCGAVLIAPGVVLSAAHCRSIFDIGKYVTVGPRKIKDVEGGKRLKIVERIFHPNYDDDWASYDMILLRLEEPIWPTSSQIQLELNMDNNWPPDDTTMTAIGFGHLKEGENIFPSILQKVELQTMNLDYCNRTLEYELYDDSFLCAGTNDGGKDTCQGDSGGPLIYIDGNRHVLTGLVSWGSGCGIAGMPGAYARVSKGISFFQKVVCECWNIEASFCSDDAIAEQRSAVGMEEDKVDELECPIAISPNCQDTPGYVDYVGDGCEWHEEWENPGCLDFGDSEGGPGFEDTNALLECCWCGGGTVVEPTPVDWNRECVDYPDYHDEFYDSCRWYEIYTEKGTCSGWGTITGKDDTTPNEACCHCGGGTYAPTGVPTATPSKSPTLSPTIWEPTPAPVPTTEEPPPSPIEYVVIRPSLDLPPTGEPVLPEDSDLDDNRNGGDGASNLFIHSGGARRNSIMAVGCITAAMILLVNTWII